MDQVDDNGSGIGLAQRAGRAEMKAAVEEAAMRGCKVAAHADRPAADRVTRSIGTLTDLNGRATMRACHLIAITALIAASCGCHSSTPTAPTATPSPTPTDTTGTNPTTQIPPCPGAGTPLFDALPIALGDFLAFRPLGFLSTPIHMFPAKHSAFSMTLPGSTAMAVPVRAPGGVWVKKPRILDHTRQLGPCRSSDTEDEGGGRPPRLWGENRRQDRRSRLGANPSILSDW